MKLLLELLHTIDLYLIVCIYIIIIVSECILWYATTVIFLICIKIF